MEEAGSDGNGGGFGGPDEGLYRLNSVGDEVQIPEPSYLQSCPYYFFINCVPPVPRLCVWFPWMLYFFLGTCQFLHGLTDSGRLVRGAIQNIFLWAARAKFSGIEVHISSAPKFSGIEVHIQNILCAWS